MQNNFKANAVNGIFFLLLVGIFYFYANYVYIGGFNIGYQYLLCGGIIVIGGVSFLASPNLPVFIECIRSIGIMSTPYLISMIVSFGIWVFTFTSIRQMISGFFAPLYIVLCAVCIGVLVYMQGKKAVIYIFWAMSIAFAIMMGQQMLEVGPGEFFYELYTLVVSASVETLPAMRALEAPRFSYCYGLFLIYFLFERKRTHPVMFIARMTVCIFCFLVGFKRSCVLGAVLGTALAFLYYRSSLKKQFINCLIACFLIFATVYIPVVRYGVFSRIVEIFDIDTSNRDDVYDYYFGFYEYNPTFAGNGLGWTQNHMKTQEGLYSYDVHNEYLRNYIELGFWGYIFWMITVFPWILKRSVAGRSPRGDGVIVGSMVYMATLYITENIFLFHTFSLVLCAVIMVCRQYGDEVYGTEKS